MKLYSDLICIDIETTDTDSKIGEIIQIGALRVSKDFQITDNFDIYVRPTTTHRKPEAMAVNQISEQTLASGFEFNMAMEMFETFCQKTKFLAAWGNYFDVEFLHTEYNKHNRKWPFHWKSIDLKSIAIWEFAKRDVEFSGGVSKGLKNLGLEWEGVHHDAGDDIKNTLRILQKFGNEYEVEHNIKRGW